MELGAISRQALHFCEPWNPEAILSSQEEHSPLLKMKHSHSDSSFKACYSVSNTGPPLLLHISDGLVQQLPILHTSF